MKESDLELVLAGADGKVMEIEMEGSEVSEAVMAAIDFAHDAIDILVKGEREVVEKFGRAKVVVRLVAPDPAFVAEMMRNWCVRRECHSEPRDAGKENASYSERGAHKEPGRGLSG